MPGLAALRRSATYASATVTTMCVCMMDTLVPFGLEVSGAIVPDLDVMIVDHHGAGGAARAMGVRGPRQHPAGKGFLAVAPAWCLLRGRKQGAPCPPPAGFLPARSDRQTCTAKGDGIMASHVASVAPPAERGSTRASAVSDLTVGRSDAVVGAPARVVFGQVMGLVAATVGFTALGAFIGRNLTGGAGTSPSPADLDTLTHAPERSVELARALVDIGLVSASRPRVRCNDGRCGVDCLSSAAGSCLVSGGS